MTDQSLEQQLVTGGLPRIAQTMALLIEDYVARLGRLEQPTFKRRLAAILSPAGSAGTGEGDHPGEAPSGSSACQPAQPAGETDSFACAEYGCGEELPKPYPPMCAKHWGQSVSRYAKSQLDPQPESIPAPASSTRSPDLEHIEKLIDVSSLGTPETKAIREQAPPEAVARVLARADELRGVIRSGDLTPGKRYRIVEIASHDKNPDHSIGDVFGCVDVDFGGPANTCVGSEWSKHSGWFVFSEDAGTFVTAVELVEDEAEQPRREPFCSCAQPEPGKTSKLYCFRCSSPIDPTIIHAAEGVTLEAASEAKPAVEGERAIVVGSTWSFSPNENATLGEVRTVKISTAEQIVTLKPNGEIGSDWRGIPALGISPREDFLAVHRWLSDPPASDSEVEREKGGGA